MDVVALGLVNTTALGGWLLYRDPHTLPNALEKMDKKRNRKPKREKILFFPSCPLSCCDNTPSLLLPRFRVELPSFLQGQQLFTAGRN